MPSFQYSAKDDSGGNTRGTIQAADVDELARLLKQRRLYLLDCKPAPVEAPANRPARPAEIVELTAYLRLLMQAGLPLVRCFEVLEEEASGDLRGTMRDIRARVMGGSSFGDALAAQGRVFPEVYLSIVRAGEQAGTFDLSLAQAERFIEGREAMKKALRKATLYPCMLIVASLAVVILLTTVVFPKILGMVKSLNVELALPTRIVMVLSSVIRLAGPPVLGLVAVGAVAYFIVSRRPAGRLRLDGLKLRVPFLGAILVRLELARFSRAAAPMFAAGIDLMSIIQAGAATLNNHALRHALARARLRVEGGQQLSDAMADVPFCPRLFTTLLKVGEATGGLDTTFDRTATIYEREIETRIGRAIAILQPSVLIFLGLVVTTTALALFMTVQTVMRQATLGGG